MALFTLLSQLRGVASELFSTASTMSLVLGLLALFLFWTIAQTLLAWYRLRHFPGPLLAKFSKWWLLKHTNGGHMHMDFAKVNWKYGPIARIAPNTLITSDPDIMRRMLSVRTPYRRSDWYIAMRFDPSRENVASERNEDKHSALRSKMAAGYSGKEVKDLESTIEARISDLLKLVDGYAVPAGEKGGVEGKRFRALDFGRKAQYFTLDVISSVAFGYSFGYLLQDSDVHDYIKTTEEVLPAVMVVTVLPWINWLLRTRLMKSVLPSERDPIGFGKIMGITKQVVGERFGPDGKDTSDMLGSFIRHGLTQDEAESETILQVVAGSDTTATAIRAIFLYIITTPHVLNRLRDEYTSTSPPISSPICDSEARKLPYLQAVIKEGLRIWPPVVGLMAKEVPAGGDMLRGKFVPGGTQVGYCAFGLFRDKAIWGEDAGVFRPERWLVTEGTDEERARIHQMESNLELIFAAGKWQCLGKNVAQIELNKVFVELLRNFDFQILNPDQPWKSFCCGIFSVSEMWMFVQRRDDAPPLY